MLNTVQISPTYQSTTKKGANKYWNISIATDGSDYYLITETWNDKDNGQESIHLVSSPTKVSPKNLGKSNETSASEQALLEYKAKIQIKIDSGYHLPGETSNILVLPQLAKKFDIKKHKKYPVILQKKLDGIRSLLTNDVFYSRQGKPLLPELFNKFHIPLDDGIHLDGELILPFPYTFQETISAIKKCNENTDKLEYHVYDLYDSNNPNLPFFERYKKLCDIVDNIDNKSIKLVDNIWCTDPEKFMYYHKLFVLAGYEGTMIRTSDAPYTPGHRSSYLMKYKDFVDTEFEILAVKGGEGLYHDCGVFECAAGKSTFNVMLADTLEVKRYVLANPQQYIGKFLKVKYQNLTDDGIPRFPVGIGVRDEVEG